MAKKYFKFYPLKWFIFSVNIQIFISYFYVIPYWNPAMAQVRETQTSQHMR